MDLTYAEFLGCVKLPNKVLAETAKTYLIPNSDWECGDFCFEGLSDADIARGVRAVLTKIFFEGHGTFPGINAVFRAISLPPVIIET